jgi:hypothetical protein
MASVAKHSTSNPLPGAGTLLLARQEHERRGSRFRSEGAADDALGVVLVLRAVRGVDLVVHVVRLYEANVFVQAAGANVPCRTWTPRNHEDVRPLTERT